MHSIFGKYGFTKVSDAMGEPVSAKVVLLGKTMVGKTSIVRVASTGIFDSEQVPTIGAGLTQREATLVDGSKIRLQIWDTAGQETYRTMAPLYYQNALVAILVFGMNDRSSFDDLKSWVEELKVNLPVLPSIAIVENKNDLDDEFREVPIHEAKQFADSVNAELLRTSAKVNMGIEELFGWVAEEAAKNSRMIERSDQIVQAVDDGYKVRKQCC